MPRSNPHNSVDHVDPIAGRVWAMSVERWVELIVLGATGVICVSVLHSPWWTGMVIGSVFCTVIESMRTARSRDREGA